MATVANPIVTRGDLGALITLNNDSAGVQGPFLDNIGETPARGVLVTIKVTALGGTAPTLTVTIMGVDKGSNTAYQLLQSAAIAANGVTTLTLFPGAPVSANVSANAELPATWQVRCSIGGTTPTVSAIIGASLLY